MPIQFPTVDELVETFTTVIDHNKHRETGESYDDIARGGNCGPRLESVLFPCYLGIWCFDHPTLGIRFSVELSRLQDEGDWLEDGPQRKGTERYGVYATFNEAFAVYSAVVAKAASEKTFNMI